jgi:hypothetical protein
VGRKDILKIQGSYKARNTLEDETEKDAGSKLRPWQVISSVLAAGLGVQSSKNRKRDFEGGNLVTFAIAGFVFTALFVGTMYLIVSTVLENAR